MTKSEFFAPLLEGFFGALRLKYDMIRAPFVVAAAFMNGEPSPLVRQRKQKAVAASGNRTSQAPDPNIRSTPSSP
jgi:hypothetical protein